MKSTPDKDELLDLLNRMVEADNRAPDNDEFMDRMEPLLKEARDYLEAEAISKSK